MIHSKKVVKTFGKEPTYNSIQIGPRLRVINSTQDGDKVSDQNRPICQTIVIFMHL